MCGAVPARVCAETREMLCIAFLLCAGVVWEEASVGRRAVWNAMHRCCFQILVCVV